MAKDHAAERERQLQDPRAVLDHAHTLVGFNKFLNEECWHLCYATLGYAVIREIGKDITRRQTDPFGAGRPKRTRPR